MALPKRRHSKSRKNKRRSHDALTAPTYTKCDSCGALVKPHAICSECGHYKGKKLFNVKQKVKK